MDGARYEGARTAAPLVAAHFARQIEAERRRGRHPAAFPPDAAVVEAIVDAAFWASLRREEGYVPRVSIAYLPPEQSPRPLTLERSLPLSPAALARVAPAVERAGIHLGVWPHERQLRVWGTTNVVPAYCFVLEVVAPALLVVKHHRGEDASKFLNVAVLEGDQLKLVDERASTLPDRPPLLTSLLGFSAGVSWTQSVNVLVQLAVSMRGHGRGGAMLVVPAGSERWRESIVHPISYGVSPAFSLLLDLMEETPPDRRLWQESLARAVATIAGLTSVDGATVLSDRYQLLAFGAKIVRRDGSARVEAVTVTEPIEGSAAAIVHPSELGGTRHLSAAQFVHDQRDSVALVASQDGHFTIFAWSPREAMVHAHKVETLLL
jgi:hypothetical protein